MNKLLIICGPTATGKTSLALELGRRFNGELISADSRQVYKGLDLLTGKDIPKDSVYKSSSLRTQFKDTLYTHGYYQCDSTRLWMVDEVDQWSEFSVSHFYSFTKTIIDDIHTRGKLPIIVGGTGLYIRSIIEPIKTASVPPNNAQRAIYSNMSVIELQNVLHLLDSDTLDRMNNSDSNNPRRLIRAIEIASWKKSPTTSGANKISHYDILPLGLSSELGLLSQRVLVRIRDRWNRGVVDEVKNFVSANETKSASLHMLGFEEISAFIQGRLSKEQAIDRWQKKEVSYVKRQRTWFKKQKDIHWYSIATHTYKRDVLHLVQEWYTKNRMTRL